MNRHPNLKHAVLAAANKEKALTNLNHFGDRWDLPRFVFLVEQLDSEHPLPNLKEITKDLIMWRDFRNNAAHSTYTSSNQVGFEDDDDLFLFIRSARKYIPKINGLSDEDIMSINIRSKLRTLQEFLWNYEDSDVMNWWKMF